MEEVDRLLRQPNPETGKGMRDKAMLELLYGTGMRVSELLKLQTEDVNLSFGYVICHDSEKERVLPIGNMSKAALTEYMDKARKVFVKDTKEKALFTNCSGKTMSRQGFWKVLKGICGISGNPQRYYAPYASSFLCSPYAAEWGRC